MESKQEILYIAFNQDASCFVVGLDSGFRIYNTHPLLYNYRRDFAGGVGIAELLYRTNIVAISGGGKVPCTAPNKVLIWDDRQMRALGEISLRYEVKGILMRREYITIICESKVYVYSLQHLKLIEAVPTGLNTRGLCAVSQDPQPLLIACPERARGAVLIKYNNLESSKVIKAHKTSISCLRLNSEASLVATASDKGTVIRVFNIQSGEAIHQMRRGIDRADIYCISFSGNSEWLAVTSDKGTLHLFSVGSERERAVTSSKHIIAMIFKRYRAKQRSFAHFKINDARTMCTFLGDTIVVLNDDGKYYLLGFDQTREDSLRLISEDSIFSLELSNH